MVNKNRLWAAVLTGLLWGSGAAFAPAVSNLPIGSTAQASARNMVTVVVDGSRTMPGVNAQGQPVYPDIRSALAGLQQIKAGKRNGRLFAKRRSNFVNKPGLCGRVLGAGRGRPVFGD